MHKRESYPEKKVNYFKQMNKALDTYQKILIVKCDNVRSMQMHNVRIALRGKAEIIMGKNTLQKKVFTARLAADESARNKALYSAFVASDLLKENVGLVLTNDDLEGVMKVLESHKVQAAARTGAIAPVEVTIPAGITGLEPTQTSFFQALNIPTKISKGAVEILKDMVILKPGDKVGNSEAALLAKLKIEPFFYGLQVTHIYEKGAVMTLAMRSITDEQLAEATQRGVDNIAALSLALGYPTEASIPYLISNAFSNLFAISLGTQYDIPTHGLKETKQAILSGAFAAPAASSSSSAAPAKADKKDKPAAAPAPAPAPAAAAVEEEEEGGVDFDLFS